MSRSVKKYLAFAIALVLWGQLVTYADPVLAAFDKLRVNSHNLANLPKKMGLQTVFRLRIVLSKQSY